MSSNLKRFDRQIVKIANLPEMGENQGITILDGYVFTRCTIEGPAVLVPRQHCNFNEPTILAAATAIFWPLQIGRTVVGGILLDNCTFDHCRFESIGFGGTQELFQRLNSAPHL